MGTKASRGTQGCASVRSAVVRGVEAVPVTVTAAGEPGSVPGIVFVGATAEQGAEFPAVIRCAFKRCGLAVPRYRVTVCVSADGLRGVGASGASETLLAVCAAIAIESGQAPREWEDGTMLAGTVEPDGSVRAPRCPSALRALAEREGGALVTGACRAALPSDCGHRCVRTIRAISAGFEGTEPAGRSAPPVPQAAGLDLIAGNAAAKRALAVGAAGGHGVLLLSRDPSLARSLAEGAAAILPPLEGGDASRTAAAWELLGLDARGVAAGAPPFRAVSAGASLAALVGGGRAPRPGEVTLANGGALYIDRFERMCERSLSAIEGCVREGEVGIVRADGVRRYPARFLPVLSAPGRPDSESPSVVTAYRARLGAWRGRIWDIAVEVDDLLRPSEDSPSAEDLSRAAARARAARAARAARGGEADRRRDLAALERFTQRIDPVTLGVARTIADMDGAEVIGRKHWVEARVLAPRL